MAEATKQSAAVSAPESTRSTANSAGSSKTSGARSGLQYARRFTKPGVSPYSEVQWERRSAVIADSKGKTIFEQKDVEVPVDWSMTATNIVASKYLHGPMDAAPGGAAELTSAYKRETGVRELIARVAESIRDWGMGNGYFATKDDAVAFHDDLVHLLVHQKVAFNSPVWFNVGCDRLEPDSDARNWHWDPKTREVRYSVTGYRNPQCSACFINSVDDSLDSILTLAKTEGMLFKWGSGTGTNLSPIRGSQELLSGGGTASGPLSFMRGFDAFAGVIKSGGKTRRAAKMVILNVDHPDIVDFVECKAKEEAKAHSLVAAGYDGSGPDSEAYSSIFFQNANNSVRVNDEFMQSWIADGEFSTKTVKDGAPVNTYKARDLMRKIAQATWACGDPGMQYDTTINRWHTSKNSGRINASNPCSEYMFLDNSACNLASFNLMKFVTPSGTFDIAAYRAAVDTLIIAMDILVDSAGYPTELISRNSHDYRPLGLGYANLGALLMAMGLPYDSDAGRDFAATLTAIMCGEAYLQSAKLAESCPELGSATTLTNSVSRSGGACPGFYVNREPFLDVIRMHRAEVNNIGKSAPPKNGVPHSSEGRVGSAEPFSVPQLDQLIAASKECWDQALAHGEKHGYRNSQVTVLAPTGTIGFMMDCDTTGIEPELALVKYKKLVGGGMIKIVNQTVPAALFKLGYTDGQVQSIVSYIDSTGTIEGAPAIKPEHLSVFDCSFKPSKGTRTIHYNGHIKMMAATQPFLSGAISKTVNLPTEATADDIAEVYVEAWKMGIKAVAIYRDGSKGVQVLNVSDDSNKKANPEAAAASLALAASAERILTAISQGNAASTKDVQSLERALENKISSKLEVSAKAIADAAHTFEIAIQNAVVSAAAPATPAAAVGAPSYPKDRVASDNAQNPNSPPRAVRHRLQEERASLTHKFSIAGHEGYITVGLYPSGEPGEIFIKMAKEGSTVSGLMDSFATAISLSLQHGVPLKVLCEKFAHTRFEPSGWTGNEHIGYAKSIMDYIFRWLQLRFLSGQQLDLFAGLGAPQPPSVPVLGTIGGAAGSGAPGLAFGDLGSTLGKNVGDPSYPTDRVGLPGGPGVAFGDLGSSPSVGDLDLMASGHPVTGAGQTIIPGHSGSVVPTSGHAADAMRSMYDMGDAPSCLTCGAIMVRNGSCYRCMSCGSTSGCS